MIDGQPLSEAQDPMVGSGGVRRLVARWVVQGTLRLETAAHLGSGEEGTDVDMPLRRDRESGKPLLTGASLAGALRSYLADRLHGYGVVESSDGDVAALFGGTRGDQYGDQSPLIVFESIGEPPNAGIEVRDGVRIASAAGVAAEHAKYDVEVSPPGTCFPLRLDLLVSDSVAEAGLLSALVAALEGLAQGEIPLGARKTRGLGRCAVSDWHAKRYDLSSQDRWLEWLLSDHRQPLTSETPKTGSIAEAVSSAWGREVALLDHDVRRRAVITVTLVSTGGLLVRSPGTGPDAPDVAHLQSGGESVLPGTSLAGALRARALRIANVVRSRQGDGPKWVNQVFGPTVPYGHADAETRLNASKIVVHESPLTAGHRLQPARIRIDRFTGGALEGALLEEEPHYLGKAQVRLELRSHQDAELGLLLLTLKDLITEDLPVGGSSSVGRGFLKGRVTLQVDGTECAFGDGMSSDAPSREKLEAYVKAFHNATPLEETSQ